MNIYIDSLTGFYIIGSMLVLILTMLAFIARWNEQGVSKRSQKTTTAS